MSEAYDHSRTILKTALRLLLKSFVVLFCLPEAGVRRGTTVLYIALKRRK